MKKECTDGLEKLNDLYGVHYRVRLGVWYKAGEFKSYDDANRIAMELSNEYDTRVVHLERTVLDSFCSKGHKVKSYEVAFTRTGVKTVKHYA